MSYEGLTQEMDWLAVYSRNFCFFLGEGRVDPICMEVKTDRQGLGRKSSLEEIARLRAKYKSEAKEKALNIDDYRTRKAAEAAEKKAFLDLMKSQRVCWELDSKEVICVKNIKKSFVLYVTHIIIHLASRTSDHMTVCIIVW